MTESHYHHFLGQEAKAQKSEGLARSYTAGKLGHTQVWLHKFENHKEKLENMAVDDVRSSEE